MQKPHEIPEVRIEVGEVRLFILPPDKLYIPFTGNEARLLGALLVEAGKVVNG